MSQRIQIDIESFSYLHALTSNDKDLAFHAGKRLFEGREELGFLVKVVVGWHDDGVGG